MKKNKLFARLQADDRERRWRAAARQNWKCWWCKLPMTKKQNRENSCTTDHIVPLSRGGPRHGTNEVAACFRCNNLRGDLPAETFLALIEAA